MAKVGIVMGSDSDMPVMAKAADILEELGISYEMTIISAHREPDVFFNYAKTAEEKGFKVIIAGAGMAGSSAWYVRSNLSNASHWHSNAYDITWRKRFLIFHRTDAIRNSCCNSSNQWRSKCRSARSKDSRYIRCETFR